MKTLRFKLFVTLISFTVSFTGTYAATVTVPGTANPWLAGMPDGTATGDGDSAPAHSPIAVATFLPGDIITFVVTGTAGHGPAFSSGPDGNSGRTPSHAAVYGLASLISPTDSLLGVFLTAQQPDSSAAPVGLDFTTPFSRDYLALAPALKQVFFIGDGHTSGNVSQQIIVPSGATRLFLGISDGFEWYNNVGNFSVTPTVTPEPSSTILLLSGFLVFIRCRRRGAGTHWLGAGSN